MKLLKRIGLGLTGLIALIATWSLIEPYTIAVENEDVVIPNLPKSWQGHRLAQVSDFQIGMWGSNTNTIRRVVQRLIDEKPDSVLISGDFLYHSMPDPSKEISQVISLMAPLLETDIPVYAVLGNHDYGMRKLDASPNSSLASQLEDALEQAGLTVLRNEAIALPQRGGNAVDEIDPLYLVGIDALLAEEQNISQALEGLPSDSPRVVMMHNPRTFKDMPSNTAPLAIAGHTHGGQVRFPFTPGWSWLTQERPNVPAASGWVRSDDGSNQLYINRGIGFSRLPIRFNCPPELTFFTLHSS